MISFTGFHDNMVTFKCDDTVTAGVPVTMNGNATVTKAASGATFVGIARSVRDGCVSVQMNGYMCIPFTGPAPTVGVTSIAADGNGGVKSAPGRAVIIVEVDTAAMECGFIL